MTYRLEGTIQNNMIWIDKHKKSHYNMTYRLEGTIQNITIWIDKHKQISLKYDIPTGGDNTK